MQQPLIRAHFWKITIGLLFVSIVGSAIFFGPFKGKLKSWRAAGLLEDAQQFAEEEKWNEVYRTAMASLQNQESIEAFRLLTKASVKTDNPQSLGLAYSLFNYPGATLKDRAWALSLAFDAGDLTNATQLASLLSPEETETSEIHYQLVRGYLMSGKYQEAISFADDPSIKSRAPEVDLLLADGLARTGLEGAREETTERLRVLLSSEDRDLALQAMSLLAFLKDQWINESLAQTALERFESDPDLTVSAQLNLELFRIGLGKRDMEESTRDAIRKYRNSHLSDLVLWLIRLEQHQKVADLTEGEEIKANPDLFKLRLHALESLNEWHQLEDELNGQGVYMPAPLLRSTQALVSLRLGDKLRSSEHWLMAMDAARMDQARNWFYQLAQTAQKLGDTDQQMEALVAAIKHPLGRLPNSEALSDLFKWMKDREEGERLLEISAILLRREPKNPLLLNNHSYLKALYRDAGKEDLEVMQDLVSRYPNEANFRETLGFISLTMGDPKLRIEVLDGSPQGPGDFSNTGKAIYAKALYNLRKREEALALSGTVDWEKITNDEFKKLALPSR